MTATARSMHRRAHRRAATPDFPDFKQFAEAACIKLWGEPDKRTRKELRWNGGDAYSARTFNFQKKRWYDAGQNRGGSTLELVDYEKQRPNRKLRGVEFFDVWREANEMGIVPKPPPAPKNSKPILATYPYRDENSVVLFEVVRFDTDDPDERFSQRQPDGQGGWIWKTKGVRKVLYRLPELIAAVKAGERLLICEGEKDADTAVRLGYVATTMPGGVKKWLKEYDEFLRGADVVVVSDNDPQLRDKKTGKPQFHPDGKPMLPGQDHAAKIAKRLSKPARRVCTIIFPQKDLTEWVDEADGTREKLDEIIEQATPQEPQPEEKEPPKGDDDADAEIERLAQLSPLEYEHQRKEAAEKLGLRASSLDRLVGDERARLGFVTDDGKQGRAITFSEPQPWPELVNGAELLDGIATAVRKHVVMSDTCRDTTALWTLHAYLIDHFLVSPRLGVNSPTKRCGKTTLLDVLARLLPRAQPTSNITPAALFRVIEAYRPTLLVDEADTFLHDNDELRGVLNSGHRKGGSVLRTVGDDHEPRAFTTYCACIIAMIGKLPDTLHDRAVTADLKRRLPSEAIEPFRPDRAGHLDELARKAVRWAQDNAERVAAADPAMPSAIINRAADNWRPLLAIADAAGSEWPQRARQVALAAHAVAAAGDDASRLEMLLADIRTISAGKVQMSSAALVEALVALEGRPWAEMGKSGKPLTQNGLARMLKPLGITTEDIWIGSSTGKSLKGYVFAHFDEPFARYLPPEGAFEPRGREEADEMGTSEPFQTARFETNLADQKCEKPANDAHPRDLADQKGGSGQRTLWGVTFDVLGAAQDGVTCRYCNSAEPDEEGGVVVVADHGPLHAACAPAWITNQDKSK